jgi:ribosomal protein L17
MRKVLKDNGEEMISTNDGPRAKPKRPGSEEIISTGNIDQIKARRAAEAEAAEKLSAGKEAAKNEK